MKRITTKRFVITDHALKRIRERHPKFKDNPGISSLIISSEINTWLANIRPSRSMQNPNHLFFIDPYNPGFQFLVTENSQEYLIITYSAHNHRKKGIYAK
ncbi:hypothetical protein OF376_00950 [Ureaplasma miroungigenitalium]|uniref:Uncharacterized protein n=1 Tax=Ureaplasma miroungigenitalium TaxID=1042321 RepID=A0ABT3BMU2_9BACT|nr:hypothetical protein [Ureaplasma miroungigenitalium]MCV3728352.1 hypothetical protein [Ureaplasma miroungigenitalium]MCV3734139.1 hypothetical protein [Ureaplasma miroungigenitalium]